MYRHKLYINFYMKKLSSLHFRYKTLSIQTKKYSGKIRDGKVSY